jgi:hypothetical protein
MTRYDVDVPAVDGLSSQVSALGVEVRATSGDVNGASCVDVGDPGLGAALSVFGQVWAGFAEAAAQAVDGTAGAISAASEAYVRVDESVVADLRVTSAFVGAVAAGVDGVAALDAAGQVSDPAAHRSEPR